MFSSEETILHDFRQNSAGNVSKCLENNDEMFPQYYMHSNDCESFKSVTLWKW